MGSWTLCSQLLMARTTLRVNIAEVDIAHVSNYFLDLVVLTKCKCCSNDPWNYMCLNGLYTFPVLVDVLMYYGHSTIAKGTHGHMYTQKSPSSVGRGINRLYVIHS